ncbi:MAG TPA: tetratricopeptide repeat protein, partial [Pirellulales bacterium]|nr:tetratricopeptide repeat protein [Pirellulales bacterium]
PALHAGYIWDDDLYVTENSTLRDLDGLAEIWFAPRATPQYYPLVHSMFWCEYHAWGLHPLGYHATNILLHGANVLLLWIVLRRLKLPAAWLAAAVFAVHPVHVESVAWITERKNVLSTCLYLLAVLAWLRFWPVDAPRPAGLKWYVLAIVAFVGALLSKSITCSLPAALLLIRWWKYGRLTRLEWAWTSPLFALGVAMACVTATLEKIHVGAQGDEWNWSLVDRMLIAGRAVWFYVAKLAWPSQLTFIYPRWRIDAGAAWQYLFPLAALGVVASLWMMRKRFGRGPLTALLLFGGTLTPALGFFSVYPMRYSFVADHFNYLSSIGLIVLAAVAATKASQYFGNSLLPVSRVLAGALLLGLATVSWQQARVYRDTETLWRDTIAKNNNCFLACNNLGCILAGRGQLDAALPLFRKTVALNPRFQEGLNNLGGALLRMGQDAEAVDVFRASTALDGRGMMAHYKLGTALCRTGQNAAGIDELRRAMAVAPDFAGAPFALGIESRDRGQHTDAIDLFEQAVKLDPKFSEAWLELGKSSWSIGRREHALECLRSAAEANPKRADIRGQLGEYLMLVNRLPELHVEFTEALRLNPHEPDVRNNLDLLGQLMASDRSQAERKSTAVARRPKRP